MGTYCYLSVGGLEVFESMDGVWVAQTTVFTPGDRVVWMRPTRIRLGYELGEEDDYLDAETLERLEPAIAYHASATVCIQRLAVRGVTLTRAQAEYETARRSLLEAFERDRAALAEEGKTLEEWRADPEYAFYDLETVDLEGDEATYQALGFGVWLEELRAFVSNTTACEKALVSEAGGSPLQAYITRCSGEAHRCMGFLPGDYQLLLRCLLEVVEPSSVVELDISDLVVNGCLEPDEEVAAREPFFTILTEGKSDKWILDKSLAILYPHLAPYYKFADFEASGLAGGIANNVQVIRTFIALSIRDRLIVLFDNDAAGNAARLNLSAVVVPENVRVLTLPDLERATDYPSLGPNGPSRSNVNSQAVSIEFFLGSDVLGENGSEPSVRWKSFQPEVGLYRGELERKTELQRRFDRVVSNPELLAVHDWADMRKLFRCIFEAFMD